MAFQSTLVLIALLSLVFTESTSAQGPLKLLLEPTLTIATVFTYAKNYISRARLDIVRRVLLSEKVIKSTRANAAGVYSFSFSPTDVLFNNPELCQLSVTIPRNSSCKFDPPGGSLRFPIIGIRSASGAVIDYIPGAPRPEF